MKKTYKKLLVLVYSLPSVIELHKTHLFEWIAILKKYPLYKDIKWSTSQKKEFNQFWKKHYGKTISCRWHKLYQSINGVFDIKYFPEILFSTKIEPILNNHNYCKILSDKSLNEIMFSNKIFNVRCPKTYMVASGGYYYNSSREIISFQSAINGINDAGECIIKPTVDTSSGKDVRFLNIVNGIDINSGDTILNILKKYNKNYIIQEKIHQHTSLSKIYPKSVNTIRIISYILDGKIYCAPPSLRVGAKGSITDNIHAGGINIGISENGLLKKEAFQLGYGNNSTTYFAHPDTGIIFENYEIPYFSDIEYTAKRLHGLNPNIGIISWDFTINDTNEIIIIEANYSGQSVWFPQIVNRTNFFGDNTKRILELSSKNKKGNKKND